MKWQLALLVAVVLVSGCVSSSQTERETVSQEKYDELMAEKMALQEQVEQLRSDKQDLQELPSTPAEADLQYRLYGYQDGLASQIAFQHPEMRVRSIKATDSMAPMISSDTMTLETTSFNAETLSPGQIIVFNRSQENIVHRIVEVNSTSSGICYATRGDNLIDRDPGCVQPGDVEAVVLGIVFRPPEQVSYCNNRLDFGPRSNYCPG